MCQSSSTKKIMWYAVDAASIILFGIIVMTPKQRESAFSALQNVFKRGAKSTITILERIGGHSNMDRDTNVHAPCPQCGQVVPIRYDKKREGYYYQVHDFPRQREDGKKELCIASGRVV